MKILQRIPWPRFEASSTDPARRRGSCRVWDICGNVGEAEVKKERDQANPCRHTPVHLSPTSLISFFSAL